MDDPVIPQNSFTPVPQALSQEPTSPVQQVPPNIQTDSVSASVLPPLPDQNNASSTPEKSQILIATESSKPKRSLAKRYVIFVIICLLLVGIGLGLSRMYISMKTSFNPVLSPIVENYLYTPGQQFSARMQTLTTVTAIGLASELKDLGMNVDTDYTDLELSTYKNTVGKLITGFELTSDSKVNATSKKPLTNILGITSEAGKIDTAFLTEWMSATNVTVSVNGTQSFDIHNRIAPKIKGTLNLRVALPNSQVSSSLDFLLHENKNLVMLKTFPENDYVDMTPIINKWIQFDSTDFSTLVAEAKKDSVKDTLEIKREYVNKLIRVATVPEFINRIKKAPPVIVNGITMKCFFY